MVFLPEACDFIGENRQQTLGLAQSVDGSTVQSFRKIAAENKVWLSLGGVHTISQVQRLNGIFRKVGLLTIASRVGFIKIATI